MLPTHLFQNEIESFNFLQNLGIIKSSRRCDGCGENMEIYNSETVDLFKWICPLCERSCSVKEDSPLHSINCSYDKILAVLFAWSCIEDIDEVALNLDVELTTVVDIYSIAGAAVENHMKRKTSRWKIGGPGILILIDTFLESVLNGKGQINRPILCLAELKGIPFTIMFHPLVADLENQHNSIQLMKENCQLFIRNFIHPGSIVVAKSNGSICSVEDIRWNQPQLKVIDCDSLFRHESEGRRLQSILSTIWEGPHCVCMDAQYYPNTLMHTFLFSHMWKNKFLSRSLFLILKEIAIISNK